MKLWLLLESAGAPATDALRFVMLSQRSRECNFVDGLVLRILELFLGQVLPGEIAKGTVGVLGCEIVLPWLIGLIVLLANDPL